MKIINNQRGFTLLLAALIASLVLILASAIFDISQKQVVLSSLAQQSQYAFYAADTAAECALYWDDRYSYFGATTPTSFPNTPPSPTPPDCDLQSFTASTVISNANQTLQSFQLSLNSGAQCAFVSVDKCQGTIDPGTLDCNAGGATIASRIVADGFNVPCSATSTSPTALERSVELNY